MAGHREPLLTILHDGLARPSALGPDTPVAIEAALAAGVVDELTLGAAAAVLYSRPELISPALIDRLYGCTRGDRLTVSQAVALRRLLGYLAFIDHARLGWTRLVEALGRHPLDARGRGVLIRALVDYVHWRPDLVDVIEVLDLASLLTLAKHRAFLLDHVVARLVHAVPEAFDRRTVDRLADIFADVPRLRYVLDALASRAAATPALGTDLASTLAARFPLRPLAAALLRDRPVAVLAVLNVRVGQGDELVRLAPFLQALLDANPAVHVTVVSPRPYLYDAPRVEAVPIVQDDAVDQTLARRSDVILDVEEPEFPDMPLRRSLAPRLDALARRMRPALLVRGDVGRHRFTYHTVALDGHEQARRLALDRGAGSIYDPCLRLLAELGLPSRAGTKAPTAPSLLAGAPSADAAAVWARLTGGGDGAARHPVAVVNPFGGRTRVKGFVAHQAPILAAELAGLVCEGYHVVLLPNGTEWVHPALLAAVLAHLPPDARSAVVVAPDPAEADPARRIPLLERPTLPYADRVMRLFKYFATYADLVCTVEGWMAHLAHALGRPFRLVLAAQSHGFRWHPHPRCPDQRLVPNLSPLGPRYEETELIGPGRSAPLPHRPRKGLLELALAGLGQVGDAPAIALLRQAAVSDDWDLRAAAVAALGRVRPLEPLRSSLVAALRDPEPVVSLRAADALLAAGVDCRRELGPRAGDILRVHRDIAQRRWESVLDFGPVALPALRAVMQSHDDAVRREARWAAGILLARCGPARNPAAPEAAR